MKQKFLKNLRTRNLYILVLFTLILVVIYRISFWMPLPALPGVSQQVVAQAAADASKSSVPWTIVFPDATTSKKVESSEKE